MTEARLVDRRARIAIDLGAESCRVSLLRWHGEQPEIELLHRIPNGPVRIGASLHWPLDRILAGMSEGLRKAATAAPEGVASIAVDGWAVDYVRLDGNGKPLQVPFCYRDERTVAVKSEADALIPPGKLFELAGAQPLRINTLYQLLADKAVGADPGAPWILLPEYMLYWLGGRRVAEYTNATHTGLVELSTGTWSPEIFDRLGLDISAAPPVVPAGSRVGQLRGELAELPGFQDTVLIAPACHDTASAIAAVIEEKQQTAYIVSGTWSLVGTVVSKPVACAEAHRAGFTNQGAAAGGYCFHANVNGMWLLKQCIESWCAQGREIRLETLIAQAESVTAIPGLIDVDAPPLLLAGDMPARINRALAEAGLPAIEDAPGNEPVFARVIFASLTHRYAAVLRQLASLTGRTFDRIAILGGGSRNALIRRLTEESCGIPTVAGAAEGSTLGNFAVQLAAAEAGQVPSPMLVRAWAQRLAAATWR